MLALVFVLSSAMASFGGSECITVTPDVPKWLKISDLVFAGTLVRNEHQDRLTFRADRIWKGKPSQPDIVVYVLGRPYIGSYLFHEGDRHLLFARVMSPWERVGLAVPQEESVAFGIHRPCGGPQWSLTLTPELDKIARGQTPPRAKSELTQATEARSARPPCPSRCRSPADRSLAASCPRAI